MKLVLSFSLSLLMAALANAAAAPQPAQRLTGLEARELLERKAACNYDCGAGTCQCDTNRGVPYCCKYAEPSSACTAMDTARC
ncbi:hypothetical protein J1614_008167 [Plenodomus biglobosus]|nr:hypothetical protein J1614_008167 [Plenodomus biglobosus]